MPELTDTPVTTAAPPEEAQNTAQTAENLIPQSRLNEVIKERNALKAMIEKEAKEREAAEVKRLEEQNQYKLLYETAANKTAELEAQLNGLTEKATAAEGVLAALWEAKKGIVPEVYRELVEALPLTGRLEWLAKNESKLTPAAKGGTPSPQGSNGNLAKQTFAFSTLKL